MSVLLGLLQHDRTELPADVLVRRSLLLRRYADGDGIHVVRGALAMSMLPYASHARDQLRPGFVKNVHGDLLCFDGRLDNYEELSESCGLRSASATDAEIVLAAFSRWKEECFIRFKGDWALSLWSHQHRRIFLARDHAGTRTLYYAKRLGGFEWSSHLDDLIEDSPVVCEDYAARYLSCRRTEHFTPYKDVFTVRPGHLVVEDGKTVCERRHWSPLVTSSIVYKHDWEYEEHFRWLLERAITRRTGDGAPILAELSGGMDSTSIVCMSDYARRRNAPDAELLDTVSYFDDEEKTLDDRRYFMAAEEHRGKKGVHLNASFVHRTFKPVSQEQGRYLLPGADSCSYDREVSLRALREERGYRSLLSGHGGDEVLGGVPTAFPALGDQLMEGALLSLLRSAFAWSMPTRTPLIQTLAGTMRFCAQARRVDRADRRAMPSWLSPSLAKRLRVSLPSFELDQHASVSRLNNAWTWGGILQTLPSAFPNLLVRFEYRYPFLDRDLVEFLFSIPPEQIQRPGQSRHLMRRTLGPLLPKEVLNRKRKGFQQGGPMLALQRASGEFRTLFAQGCLVSSGFVDVASLLAELDRVARGQSPELVQSLLRAVGLEIWMRTLPTRRVEAPETANTVSKSSGTTRSTGSQETTGTPVIA